MRIIKSGKLGEEFFQTKEFEDIESVKEIIERVKKEGDRAVRYYTKKFDKLDIKAIKLSKMEIKEAFKKVNQKEISALKEAAKNIRFFAKRQFKMFKDFEVSNNGATLGQKIIPIENVGCYVPGGSYPLPSSALMTIIPAKVAGVKKVIVCSPKIKPITIVAASIAGADEIFRIGGVQAIAAMAYGTETVPKVDKIVGPGNRYVVMAKKLVYGQVGIDFLAGPSEVLIISDSSGNPKFIAADLLAQAEHDKDANVNLITTSKRLAEEVNKEIKKKLGRLKTREIASASIKKGRIVIVKSIMNAVRIANKKAPEHLELQVKRPERIIDKLSNYGSLFIGKYSAEVFGDYCSGPNHTLPTNRASRFTGGLSVKDFVKILTYQYLDKKGAKRLGKTASILAEIEGLEGHKNAALARI